jgi:hypothetical protein
MHVVGGLLFVFGLSVKAIPTGRNKDDPSIATSYLPSSSSVALKAQQTRSLLSSSVVKTIGPTTTSVTAIRRATEEGGGINMELV